MSDSNERELTTYGFTKSMRTGLITSLLGLMIGAIVYLFFAFKSSEKEKQAMQKDLYEKMLQRVDEKMKQPLGAINDVIGKVDTAAHKATEAANKVDSISDQYLKTKKR